MIQRGRRGAEWQLEVAAVHNWLIDQKLASARGNSADDVEELRRRKLAAEAEMAELELAKSKGAVCDLEMIERNLATLFETLKANLRNVPGRVVSALVGQTDEREIKRLLLDEIELALSELADAGVTVEDDGGDDGAETV